DRSARRYSRSAPRLLFAAAACQAIRVRLPAARDTRPRLRRRSATRSPARRWSTPTRRWRSSPPEREASLLVSGNGKEDHLRRGDVEPANADGPRSAGNCARDARPLEHAGDGDAERAYRAAGPEQEEIDVIVSLGRGFRPPERRVHAVRRSAHPERDVDRLAVAYRHPSDGECAVDGKAHRARARRVVEGRLLPGHDQERVDVAGIDHAGPA